MKKSINIVIKFIILSLSISLSAQEENKYFVKENLYDLVGSVNDHFLTVLYQYKKDLNEVTVIKDNSILDRLEKYNYTYKHKKTGIRLDFHLLTLDTLSFYFATKSLKTPDTKLKNIIQIERGLFSLYIIFKTIKRWRKSESVFKEIKKDIIFELQILPNFLPDIITILSKMNSSPVAN